MQRILTDKIQFLFYLLMCPYYSTAQTDLCMELNFSTVPNRFTIGRLTSFNQLDFKAQRYSFCQIYINGISTTIFKITSSRAVTLLLLLVFCCSNSRSMTPIAWQAVVDDEEQ